MGDRDGPGTRHQCQIEYKWAETRDLLSLRGRDTSRSSARPRPPTAESRDFHIFTWRHAHRRDAVTWHLPCNFFRRREANR
jgi:hypothetical protein